MNCQHEIEGEDYGMCRQCGRMFFRTSGGLWQSYDDGKRCLPSPTDRQMDAAISAINQFGFDFRAPWECDLDDREREQFEGLKAAVLAALTLAPRPRE